MDAARQMDRRGSREKASLRGELAHGDLLLGNIKPILGHLLSTPDHSLFSDEIIARLRGMLNDLAWQILRAQAEATGQAEREAFAQRHGEALAGHFQASTALLAHCHALAIEWQLTERLEAQYGLDPVLSPLLQEIIANPDPAISSAAMAALTAQARFAQAQRRMELSMAELPGDLFHDTLLAWRKYNGDKHSDAMLRAESKLRNSYDESTGRLALFARLVSALGGASREALMIEQAGAALFFAALSARSGQSRQLAVLSSNPRQTVRLALGLRAAGLEAKRVDDVLLRLHPGAAPVVGLEGLGEAEARKILADAGTAGIG